MKLYLIMMKSQKKWVTIKILFKEEKLENVQHNNQQTFEELKEIKKNIQEKNIFFINI